MSAGSGSGVIVEITRHVKICRICRDEEPLAKVAQTIEALPHAVSSCPVFHLLYRKWQQAAHS